MANSLNLIKNFSRTIADWRLNKLLESTSSLLFTNLLKSNARYDKRLDSSWGSVRWNQMNKVECLIRDRIISWCSIDENRGIFLVNLKVILISSKSNFEMKLIFAILLILPLGEGEQWILIVPEPPKTESPLSALANQTIWRPPADVKIVYKEGFVVAKGKDLPIIHFNSYNEKWEFFMQNNASNDNHGASMVIKEQPLREVKNTSFVVEAWPHPGTKKELDTVSCWENSNETLRHLIASCFEDVRLRPATQKEIIELQRFKEEYNRKLLIRIQDLHNGCLIEQSFHSDRNPNSLQDHLPGHEHQCPMECQHRTSEV